MYLTEINCKNYRVIDDGGETAETELNVSSENQENLITHLELINRLPDFLEQEKQTKRSPGIYSPIWLKS